MTAATFLYVLTDHPRTTQTFIQAELDALRAGGHEVHVVALNEPPESQLRGAVEQAELAWTLYLRRAGARGALGAMMRAAHTDLGGTARVLVDALRSAGTDVRRMLWRTFHFLEALIVWDHAVQHGVDHVHAHFGQSTSTIAWMAVRLAEELGSGPTDLVITIHCGTEVEDAKETIPERKVITARKVIAISDHTRSQIMRHVPAEHWEKIEVIRCGVSLDFFGSGRSAPRDGPPVIVFVGRLAPVKGVPLLVDACERLVARGVDLRLEVVGGGPLADPLAERIDGLDWATLVGELPPDGVRDRLRKASVFCLPSLDEGIPVSMMEAMAMGVPVVTTAVAGIPELAVDGETAIVVPPGNVDALTAGLERVLTQAHLRSVVVEAALVKVAEMHDAAVNLPRLLEVLEGPSPSSRGVDTT